MTIVLVIFNFAIKNLHIAVEAPIDFYQFFVIMNLTREPMTRVHLAAGGIYYISSA